MAKFRNSSKYYVVFFLVAFGIAAICLLGIVLGDDFTGRIIFGGMWSLVAVYWLGRYLCARRAAEFQRD